MDEVVRFALTPRFALLGGWKANWQIGYNLNTQGYLKVQDNNFELRNIPLGYALNKVMSESYSIKVILPEDSKNTKITVGNNVVDMKNVEKSLSFGYLDFSGRPVYTVKGLNGIFEKKQIKVQYNYEATGIFKKPFYIFGAISSLLMLVVIVKRLNFSAFEEHSKP